MIYKRIFLMTFALLLICGDVDALMSVNTGSVTRDNFRCNYIAENAFLDFATANTLTSYIGYKVTITDSANKTLTGWIKSVGAGETPGEDVFANWDFTSSWTAVSATVNDNDTFTTVAPGGVWYNADWVVGQLYKYTVATSLATMQSINGSSGVEPLIGTGSGTFYFTRATTSNPTRLYLRNNTGSATDVTTLSAIPITSPSATGVYITPAYDCTTKTWTSEESGFNRNDPSGYTYTIYPGTTAVTADNVALNYSLIDCQDAPGMLGIEVTGAAFVGQNLTVVRCPAGAYQFSESATLTNSIGISAGEDIRIATGKTVAGTYNLFDNAAKAGDGTYSDAGSTTKWSSDPKFVGTADFRLSPGSPAINAGTPVGLTSDYAGNAIRGLPDIGAYEYQGTNKWFGRQFPAFPSFPNN
jgi:hypothetical protein